MKLPQFPRDPSFPARGTLPAHESLSLNTPWGIGEQSFQALVQILRSKVPRTIVEFGSGSSSVRLAMEFPDVDILSIEHDPNSLQQVIQLRDQHAPKSRLRVQLRPLAWQRHGAGLYLSYEPGEFPGEIDAIIIDGPPYWTRRGREACLYQTLPSLRAGATVFLDDVCRPHEQQIMRNWMSAIPNALDARILEVGHRIGVLCTTRSTNNLPRPCLSVFKDTAFESAIRGKQVLRRNVFTLRKWLGNGFR